MAMLCLLLTMHCGILNPVTITGPDALEFNPAQLAYPERTEIACRIIGLAAEFDNNSFSAASHNRYSGAYLDDAAKSAILGSIPAQGFRGNTRFESGVANFSYGCLAASLRITGEGTVTIPRDLFELLLFGNKLGRVYRAEPLDGSAQMLLRAGIAGASAVGHSLAVGAAAHYIRGLLCAELTEGSAYFLTTPDALIAQGKVAYRTATGGSGFAFDAGVAYWSGEWRASLSVLDFSPGIRWEEGIDEGYLKFSLDSANIWRLAQGTGARAEFERTPGKVFVTDLPLKLNLGLSRSFGDKLSGCFVIRSKLQRQSQATVGLQPAVSVDFWPRRWLAAGLGVSYETGRGIGVELSGLAVWRRFALRLGFEDIAGVLLGARGAGMQFSLSYGTLPRGISEKQPEVLRLTPGVN